MKQIEFETHIAADNVAEIVIDSLVIDVDRLPTCKWYVLVLLKVGGAAAVHAARGEVKYFATIDTLVRFVRDCGWSGEMRLSRIGVKIS